MLSITPRLDALGSYAFRRLNETLAAVEPADLPPLDLGIGEPQHTVPALLAETLTANAHLWNKYPKVDGTPDYRQAVAAWLTRRYDLPGTALDPDRHVLPVAGTKEALFMLAQLTADGQGTAKTVIAMPNPVYTVYLAGAVFAQSQPLLLQADSASGFLPDLDQLSEADWQNLRVFYLCSPSNPQGTVANKGYLQRLIGLARAYDVMLIVDECYSEIYDTTPPPGALAAAWALDRSFDNLIVCHSLSKRSNAAGLRSGFVAGDARLIRGFAQLRSYAAAVQPIPVLAAAAALWRDEAHAAANRAAYRSKLDDAENLFGAAGAACGFYRPPGGFFLWLDVGDGEVAMKRLWREAAVRALPGAYLAFDGPCGNPGARYLRLALVHERATNRAALERVAAVLNRAATLVEPS